MRTDRQSAVADVSDDPPWTADRHRGHPTIGYLAIDAREAGLQASRSPLAVARSATAQRPHGDGYVLGTPTRKRRIEYAGLSTVTDEAR